jgi:hypothetical protein
VRRYGEAFWDKGSVTFPPAEWEKVVKAIEKGEKQRIYIYIYSYTYI